MEATGEPGRVHLTAETYAALGGRFAVEARARIEVKGPRNDGDVFPGGGRPLISPAAVPPPRVALRAPRPLKLPPRSHSLTNPGTPRFMLGGIRAAQTTWLGKTLTTLFFGLMLLAFVVWGMGDPFRGGSANSVAQVGDVSIPTATFKQEYQRELQDLQRRARRAITTEEAHRIGLDAQVLTRLMSEAVLDDEAGRMDLAMSDAEVAKQVVADPSFAGPGRHLRSRQVRPVPRQPRPDRAGLRARAAQRLSAPGTRRRARRRSRDAAGGSRGAPPLPGRSPQPRLRDAARRRGRRDRGARRRSAADLLRCPQGSVHGSAISQARDPAGDGRHPGEARCRGGRRRPDALRPGQGRPLRVPRDARRHPDGVRHRGAGRELFGEDQGRKHLRRSAEGRQPARQGGRSRHGRQGADHRSGDRRGRLRAASRRHERSGQGPVRHRRDPCGGRSCRPASRRSPRWLRR